MRKWLIEIESLGRRFQKVCDSYGEASAIAAERYPDCCPIVEYADIKELEVVTEQMVRYRTQVEMLNAGPKVKEMLRQYADLAPRERKLIDDLVEVFLSFKRESAK